MTEPVAAPRQNNLSQQNNHSQQKNYALRQQHQALLKGLESWHIDTSPLALSEIFSPDISVAIWRRDCDLRISNYFLEVFTQLGMGIRNVFSMDSLKEGLHEALPEGAGKDEAVADIYLLSDMLTCLVNCNAVGLRIEPLSRAMCPKLHTDNIPLRLVNTYLGPGTEWLPREYIGEQFIGKQSTNHNRDKYAYNQEAIQQMHCFDVGLLKGSAWEKHEHMAAVHRSCQLQENQKRVLLTLDPM